MSYMCASPNRDEALARPAPRPRRFLAHERPQVTRVRAFVALDVGEDLRRAASDVTTELRRHALAKARASWVQTAHMHVTVRFLGDVDEERVPELAALTHATAADARSVVLRARRLGAFPDPQRARVLILPLEDDDGVVARLFAVLGEGLLPLGFVPEARPYVPHLTLARFRAPIDVRTVCETMPFAAEGPAEALALYASELTPEGPRYTALARGALA